MPTSRLATLLLLLPACSPSGDLPGSGGEPPSLQGGNLATLYEDLDLAWHIHDPSRAVSSGPSRIIGVTGKENADGYDCGLELWASGEGGDWEPDSCLLRDKPAWISQRTPGNDGAYWAPALVDANTLYYSVSDFETDASCVGRAERGDDGSWQDHGAPITCSEPEEEAHPDVPNSIDPAWFVDVDGTEYLVYGGGSIWAAEVDPGSGEVVDGGSDWDPQSTAYHHLASPPEDEDPDGNSWIEAPYLHEEDGFYYLFVNWYACCSGVDSTYEIRVGRSQQPTGPFVDRSGRDLHEGGGTLLLDSQGEILGDESLIGPGHAAINPSAAGLELSFHYYDGEQEGLPWIAAFPLDFQDGWPVVDPAR